MRKLAVLAFVLSSFLSCGTTPKLIVKNGMDSTFDMYLSAYTKRFSSHYTIVPGKSMTIGEYKNNAYDYTTVPYMFIRTKHEVSDSILYSGNRKISKLNITEFDTLRVERHILDSLFAKALDNNPKKNPKRIIWAVEDAFFEKETIRQIEGARLSSQKVITQQAIDN